MFHRVHGYGNRQREVRVALDGLVLSVQHINQEGRAVGLFVPAIQPAVAEQWIGTDGTGHPRARGFEDIDFNPGIIDVPPIAFHIGV